MVVGIYHRAIVIFWGLPCHFEMPGLAWHFVLLISNSEGIRGGWHLDQCAGLADNGSLLSVSGSRIGI